MVSFKHGGDFKNTESFLKGVSKIDLKRVLESYGQRGVDALASATPIDSGITAESWGYEVRSSNGIHTLIFTNSNVIQGFPVAIGLQYGHATKGGGYVQGHDFINPALQPIIEQIINDGWQEVTRL